jgi:hypothetical protein
MTTNESFFKCYCSDHTFGFGRFIVITTSQYHDNKKDIVAEAFIFGLDTSGIFQGIQVKYKHHTGDEKIANFDLQYMENEARNQARILIYKLQQDKYKNTKDIDFLRKDFEFKECDKNSIISLKNTQDYAQELAQLTKWTINSELSDYILIILSFPKLTIETYNP